MDVFALPNVNAGADQTFVKEFNNLSGYGSKYL